MKIELKDWEKKIVETALRAYYVRQESDMLFGLRLVEANEKEEGHRRIEWAKGKQAAIKKVLCKIMGVSK